MGAERAVAPILSGSVPPLATAYQPRQETGFGLADQLRPGETCLLVPAAPGDPGGGMTAAGATGGTGKTQLAVGFAHAMWSARAVDLLVWVPADSRTAVLAGYARAAADLEIVTPSETADTGARRFLRWLHRTERRWAVVLDGITSPVDLDGLWPQGPSGQVVATTRLRAAELSGPGRTAYGVPGFSMREALSYLLSRLTAYPDQRIEALDLAEDLGGLPIAMAQAASVIMAAESTCRDYRAEYDQRLRATADTIVDGCPQSLLAAWSLAVEHAHELPPTALAWPALVFAAVLDTGGIPAAVLTSPAACGFITGRSEAAGDRGLVRSAYAALEQFDLVSVDTTDDVRTVRIHPTVRAATRAYLTPGSADQAVQAAAAALLEAWPPPGPAPMAAPWEEAGWTASGSQLGQALRDCTAALRAFGGDLLWKPEAHPVLLRAGESLTESPALADSAIIYWQSITATAAHLLGHGHAQSVLTRDRLADAYAIAGRLAEALAATEATLADRERALGPLHPDTVTAQVNAARSLAAAGREPEAIPVYEQALAARERLFGPAHPDTLAVRVHLAAAYSAAGRRGDSIRLYERTLADSERELGPAHPDTMATRTSLADVYLAAGQLRDAITVYQHVLADTERVSGADHPDTLTVRAALANAHRLAGRAKESISEHERVLAARERVQGADHPDTIAARASLGYAYRTAGRLKDAIAAYERAVADTERVAGPADRDTITARASLAAAYQLGRRPREAIAAYERAAADGERALGPGDADALTIRCQLATAYAGAARPADATVVLRRALADGERYLGPDHPVTRMIRESMRAAE